MVPRARCWQVHSALTQKVNAIEAVNDRFHAAWQGTQSGQLLFLGSSRVANWIMLEIFANPLGLPLHIA